MPASPLVCVRVSPSAPAELAWLLDLLVQTAPYGEPALDELDRSLLPGLASLRTSIKDRFESLWNDGVAGCPELLIMAEAGRCRADDDPRRLLAWLSTLPRESPRGYELASERAADRRLIRGRLVRLGCDIRLRRSYRNILSEVWERVRPVWERKGRTAAAKASKEWSRRLGSVSRDPALVQLMPPRHPLTLQQRPSAVALLRRRRRFSLVPIYFCMSGGQLTDLGDEVHIGVPASALEPVRRMRDAAYVADRARLLSEPTRVHILIYLMSSPSGVMEMTRALRMSQPTVSEHVRILAASGLVRRQRKGSRTVYVPLPQNVERLVEDARATLARWSATSLA